MAIYKYIADISHEDLDKQIVIPCINESGFRCILIKNKRNKKVEQDIGTNNLSIKENKVLILEGDEYYFHIICSTHADEISNQKFDVVYNYVFKKIVEPIDDNEITSLVSSLEEYFQLSAGKDSKKKQVGLFGELLFVKDVYDLGFQSISFKYHKDFYSKHDIEISDKLRIEIKTSLGDKRIHRFNQEQISRNDIKVLVASILLEESQEGISLWDLFCQSKDIFPNIDEVFSIEKFLKECGVDKTNKGITVSLQEAVESIKIFDAKYLPKIPQERVPNGISNIEYDSDCSLAQDVPMNEFLNIIKNEATLQ